MDSLIKALSMTKYILLSLLLITLSSCGQSSGLAPDEISGLLPFDGVTCAVTVEQDMTADEFEAILQDGNSASDPFIVCIGENVSINEGSSNDINMDFAFLHIQGFSNTSSLINNVTLTSSTHDVNAIFRRLRVTGTGAGGVAISSMNSTQATFLDIQDCNVISEHRGIHAISDPSSELIIRNTTISTENLSIHNYGDASQNLVIENSQITSIDSDAIFIHALNSSAVTIQNSQIAAKGVTFEVLSGFSGIGNFNIANSTFNATSSGLEFNQYSIVNATIENTTITTGATGIYMGTIAVDINLNLGGNTIRANGGNAGTYTSMYLHYGNNLIMNDISSKKHLTCNDVNSPATNFTKVLETTTPPTGTFSIANTQNGDNNTIPNCP